MFCFYDNISITQKNVYCTIKRLLKRKCYVYLLYSISIIPLLRSRGPLSAIARLENVLRDTTKSVWLFCVKSATTIVDPDLLHNLGSVHLICKFNKSSYTYHFPFLICKFNKSSYTYHFPFLHEEIWNYRNMV